MALHHPFGNHRRSCTRIGDQQRLVGGRRRELAEYRSVRLQIRLDVDGRLHVATKPIKRVTKVGCETRIVVFQGIDNVGGLRALGTCVRTQATRDLEGRWSKPHPSALRTRTLGGWGGESREDI